GIWVRGSPMKALHLATISLFVSTAAFAGSAPTVTVLSSRPVSTDDRAARHVETALAIDPTDPRRLVAASIVFGSKSGVAVYSTPDGGDIWQRATTATGADLFPGIDPALTFDDRGRAFLVTMAHTTAVWRSDDGGLRWRAPATIANAGLDRP